MATMRLNSARLLQVDVVFEEVDEIVLQDSTLPFVAGRLAEPVQPNLLRMRELLAASKQNVVLVDGVDQVSLQKALFLQHRRSGICCFQSSSLLLRWAMALACSPGIL